MPSLSNFIRHEACPNCGSSDGLSVYSDNHTHCFVCSKNTQLNTESVGEISEEKSFVKELTPLTTVFRAIPKRNLTEDAIRKYGIDVNLDKTQDVAHRYPYNKDGVHVANKVRRRTEKTFYYEGDPDGTELFGQSLFAPGSAKQITVVEGELDAPSAWLLMGSKYPVVSVGSAGSAVKDCRRNFEYLDSFDEIVFNFDKDEAKRKPDGTVFYPGQEAAEKCAQLFKPGKCRLLFLEKGKDANDYRQQDIPAADYVREWWRAPRYTPAGLVSGSDMLDSILNRPLAFSVPYPWEPLNDKTYGIRLSEAVLLMADTGVGKTSILKEIEHHLLTHPEVIDKGYGVGFLHLEEPNHDTALGLLSIQNSKPYHLPDTERTEEELKDAWDKVLNNSRAVFYDHFGSNDIEDVLAKVRFMSVMGCKYIFIDHLSIIVSDQSGDERKQLDEISTKLKMLTMELNIAVFCVIHTNREGQARGSAGPEKVANIHFSLTRNKKDPDDWRRNVLKLEIEKNRFCGRTGPCLWLFYDGETDRLIPLDDEQIVRYESGGTLNDSELSWG